MGEAQQFDPKKWLEGKGKEFNGVYASIKSIDKSLNSEKIFSIANAIANMKLAEVNTKKLDSSDANNLLKMGFSDFQKAVKKNDVSSTVNVAPQAHAATTAPAIASSPVTAVPPQTEVLIPKPTVESLRGNYEAQKTHITKMAESVNARLELVTDHAELIKTMLPMGIHDLDFGYGATEKSVIAKLAANDPKIIGIKQANYSYDILIKAANDPLNRTTEFNEFLSKMVSSGKIQENQNNSPIYSTREKGSVILMIAETGSGSNEKNIGYMRHELRHAIMANIDSRKNTEFLNRAETIIQGQSPEWKKKTLTFFIGTPYIDRLIDPIYKDKYTKLVQTLDMDKKDEATKTKNEVAKTKFVEDYFSKSENNNKFYISNKPNDRAVALDEFIAYTTDKSPSGVDDIPAMKQLLQGEITKANTTNLQKWTPEQYQALMDELN